MPLSIPLTQAQEDELFAEFVHGYCHSLLFFGLDPDDAGYAVEDMSDEARRACTEDCRKFWHDMRGFIAHGPDRAGHDFYLTRCGHGCGFWDSDCYGSWSDVLTARACEFPDVTPYVGDDNRVYLT